MKRSLILLAPLLLFSCDFNKQQDTPIEFSLSANKTNLKVNESAQLTISLKDKKDIERAKFTYASSDESILKPISFENNIITLSAITSGNATITITETTYDTSHRLNFEINPIEIILNDSFVNVKKDESYQLTANIDDINWESDDETIATVDTTGLVTGVNEGQATIYARYKVDSSTFATCQVNVYESGLPKTVIEQNYKDYAENIYYSNYACTPADGNINLLVIPIWFNDSSNYIVNDQKKQYVHEDIEMAYFGTNEQVGYRSVKTYYGDESSGKLTINGLVTDWYDTQQDSSYYGVDDDSTSGKMISLLESAVSWAETTESLDLNIYDNDKDGYLDGVIMIYARPDYLTEQSEYENFWAYCSYDYYRSPIIDNPVPGKYFWASYDFMYGNNSDDRFPRTSDRTGTWYGRGNPYREIIDTSTFIHEMGHMFGLCDYYDYTYSHSPAAGYTMQDNNVSTHDPFSYLALNWASPYIPTNSCTITIGDFPLTHDVILLTPEWNEYDSPFDEYILLELYSLTGLNEHFKGDWFHSVMLPDAVGIRVWHVDARLLSDPWYGYSEAKVTSDVNAGNNVYKLCDNTFNKIVDFPKQSRGSFICKNQNMLQLINQRGYNHGGSFPFNFYDGDLFYEGDTFTLDGYKEQFINIDTGEFYTETDTDIRLNNRKKLNWSFTVNDITTRSDGSSTATITLNKLA